jgi:hypothetical protein
MMLALLLPVAAYAKRITAAGSVEFTNDNGGDLVGKLVVVTVMSNPGLEKTVTQNAPLAGNIYVLPFFVDQETGNSGPGNLDTVMALTNTTGDPLSIKLTIRGADGAELPGSGEVIELGPHATKVVVLSDVLD